MATKHTVLQAHLEEWLACKGDRKRRGSLTKQLSILLKVHPKSVGRSMKRLQLKSKFKPPKKRGRKIYYDKSVDAAVEKIWEEMEYPAGENMHSIINVYINHFIEANDWNFNDITTGKLRAMSLGTLKNRIARMRKKKGVGKGRSATISSPLKGMIPIRKSHTWQGLSPGYVQTDSVVHCGDMLTGDVVYSVGCVDFATYWSDYTVQWNKGMLATCESLKCIRARFPFPLIEIHPDTGTEFINNHVLSWTRDEGIAMTRSEPYKKNDNMCIEERNGNLPRKHLGYVRMDEESLVETASEIMKVACLLHNHFRPVRRMVTKTREGAKWKRTFEKVSQTPYQRVLNSSGVSNVDKVLLREVHQGLSPLQLRKELDILKVEMGKKLLKIKKSRTIQ